LPVSASVAAALVGGRGCPDAAEDWLLRAVPPCGCSASLRIALRLRLGRRLFVIFIYFVFFSSESCRSEQFLIYFDFINDGAALCP
jgi:hypothetical protein